MSKTGKVYTGTGLLLLTAALILTIYNLWSDAMAGASSGAVLKQITLAAPENTSGDSLEEPSVPDYVLNPEMDMPEEEVDGLAYIGVLEIPSLPLSLPVISEWSYPNLKVAPCRYNGSVYLNNMVIAAHDYCSHFGPVKGLSQGDEVIFTDVDGNVFRYEVVEMETLSAYDVEEMVSGDWDLTLFTCTIDGQSRMTVRCELAEKLDMSEYLPKS